MYYTECLYIPVMYGMYADWGNLDLDFPIETNLFWLCKLWKQMHIRGKTVNTCISSYLQSFLSCPLSSYEPSFTAIAVFPIMACLRLPSLLIYFQCCWLLRLHFMQGLPGSKFNPFKSQTLQPAGKVQHVINVNCKVRSLVLLCDMPNA